MITHLLALLVTLTGGVATGPADEVNFTRTYKAGEKVVYVYSSSNPFFHGDTLTVDITETAQKLLNRGRAQLLVHFSDLKSSDQTTLPGDVTISTGPNNMPARYTPAKGSMNFVSAWLQLANVTADKSVKVGDEVPLDWDSRSEFGGCKGTIKILEITPEKKQMKALIDVTWTAYGQTAGMFTLTSTYDTTDFSLVSSTGKLLLGGLPSQAEEMSFTRKTPHGPIPQDR